MIQGTRYCHGMDYEVLMSIATHNQEAAVKEVRERVEGYSKTIGEVITVLSADESQESDVSQMVDGWRVKYFNVKLPRWKDRENSQAYLETQITKEARVRVKEVECP
jgi:hypothetical protein